MNWLGFKLHRYRGGKIINHTYVCKLLLADLMKWTLNNVLCTVLCIMYAEYCIHINLGKITYEEHETTLTEYTGFVYSFVQQWVI